MHINRTLFVALCGLSFTASAAPKPDSGTQCNGRVVVANPAYRGSASPKAAGQGVTADPPVPIRQVTVIDGALHANTLYELWTASDLAHPKTIRRYAGVDTSEDGGSLRFRTGACADARFPQISGVAAGPGGSLIVTDRLANAVLRVDHPGQDGCTVTTLAGNAAEAKTVSPAGLGSGNQDGDGAAARFHSPAAPAVDDAGNVYVLDNHNRVRRIAANGAHAVTTIAALKSDGPGNDGFPGMTWMAGKLYVVHLRSLENVVVEVDPTNGKERPVISGNGKSYPPLDSSVVPGLADITNDGSKLFVTGRSYVWTLTPAGALTLVAGSGADEFRNGYDPAAAQPASKLIIPGNASNVSLGYLPGHGLLLRGRAGSNNNSYLMEIDCP